MTKIDVSAISELKTLGFTPLIYCSDQALFNVRAGVPIVDALSQASDLLFLVRSFTEDAAYAKRHRPPRLGRALPDGDE